MPNISHPKAPVKALVIPMVTAILVAFSASVAFADAADRDLPDNPIMAEQYFYSHQAEAEQRAAAGQEVPFFAQATPDKPVRMMHIAKKAHHLGDMPRR